MPGPKTLWLDGKKFLAHQLAVVNINMSKPQVRVLTDPPTCLQAKRKLQLDDTPSRKKAKTEQGLLLM